MSKDIDFKKRMKDFFIWFRDTMRSIKLWLFLDYKSCDIISKEDIEFFDNLLNSEMLEQIISPDNNNEPNNDVKLSGTI